ncbi:MAG: hypothetical protein LAT64_13180 [Phycisphaerales bacterium]|nr:hypothetical protein [Planctomycetota bacterium]MCH8509707.1 hypothetical protein [Phycisphaerales bacterium]
MTPPDEHQGEEFSEFLFQAKDLPDGTTPDDADEARRKRAIQQHAKMLAKKHGFEIETTTITPGEPTDPTERAAEIAAIAHAVMPERDAAARNTIEHAKVETPDGVKITRTFINLGFLDDLGKALKQLADPVGLKSAVVNLSKRLIRVSIRVGSLLQTKVDLSDRPEIDGSIEAKAEQDSPVDSE